MAIVALFAGWRGWAPARSPLLWMVAIAARMLVCIALAVLTIGLTVNLCTALGITGTCVATGLAFSGFSCPRVAWGEAAQWWSGLLALHLQPAVAARPVAGRRQRQRLGMAPLLRFIAQPSLIGMPLPGRAVRNQARWGGR